MDAHRMTATETVRAYSRIRLHTPRSYEGCARCWGRLTHLVSIRRPALEPCRVLGQQSWRQSSPSRNGSAAEPLQWHRREPGTRDLAVQERPGGTRLATAQMAPNARRHVSAPGLTSFQPTRPRLRTTAARGYRSSFVSSCSLPLQPAPQIPMRIQAKTVMKRLLFVGLFVGEDIRRKFETYVSCKYPGSATRDVTVVVVRPCPVCIEV